MTLYLTQTWCLSFRFQLTLASKLLRFKRCVAGVEVVVHIPGLVRRRAPGPAASSWGRSAELRDDVEPARRWRTPTRPVPSRLPVKGSKTIPSRSGTEPPSVVGTIIGVAAGIQNLRPQLSAEIPGAEVGRWDGKETGCGSRARRCLPSRRRRTACSSLMGPPRLPPSMFRMPLGFFCHAGAILIPPEGPQGAVVVHAEKRCRGTRWSRTSSSR